MKKNEIKVEVTLTEGYEKRFTEACLQQLSRRDDLAKTEQIELQKQLSA